MEGAFETAHDSPYFERLRLRDPLLFSKIMNYSHANEDQTEKKQWKAEWQSKVKEIQQKFKETGGGNGYTFKRKQRIHKDQEESNQVQRWNLYDGQQVFKEKRNTNRNSGYCIRKISKQQLDQPIIQMKATVSHFHALHNIQHRTPAMKPHETQMNYSVDRQRVFNKQNCRTEEEEMLRNRRERHAKMIKDSLQQCQKIEDRQTQSKQIRLRSSVRCRRQ